MYDTFLTLRPLMTAILVFTAGGVFVLGSVARTYAKPPHGTQMLSGTYSSRLYDWRVRSQRCMYAFLACIAVIIALYAIPYALA